jgi:PAS domain S-box-containing protein
VTEVEPRTGLSGTWQIPATPYIEDYRVGGSWIRSGPQVKSCLGYTPEETYSHPNFWKTILYPADRDRVLAEDQRCDQTLEPWRCTYRIHARDGRTVWLRDEAEIVCDDTGEPSYWQGVYLDITDQTMARRETARRLAALDEQKNALLTAVSHELRTPLTAILGASVTLERAGGRLSEEAIASLLGGLSASARRLDRLLTNLLDLEQLAWGAIPLHRRPFDIAALLEQVASRWQSDPPWPLVCASSTTVWLDPDKVERIVEELLANTARHIPPGTPVWIRADRQGTGVRLAVEDAGPGVPSELRASVFEGFRHGDTAPSYAPGLGIGLSLVLRLAELHGGTAWVEDRSGGGASFQVILPGPAR